MLKHAAGREHHRFIVGNSSAAALRRHDHAAALSTAACLSIGTPIDDTALQRARPDRAGGGGIHVAEGLRRMKVWPERSGASGNARRGRDQGAFRSRRAGEHVFMPFCYAEAAANLLTNPALDRSQDPEFKFCAVKAERAEVRTAAE